MHRLNRRTRELRGRVDVIDTTALRTRILEAVEEAIDRAETALQEAPSAAAIADVAKERADRVRRSQLVEAATAAAGAGMPIVVGVLRSRMTARNASRMARVTPAVLRTHPLLFGAAVAGGALVGVAYLRRQQAEQAAELEAVSEHDRSLLAAADRHEEQAGGSGLEHELERMEGEGGDVGVHDGTATPSSATS